ncbi:MAG: hypothetical protein LPJ89_11555 [Hymenobacteraceae bacterium]|nr:hypothetical protein [Hymenobacteraceae bacterium]MDX5396344.1 hypothetical protein [Hymenobacteraceae bacterium]MDX5444402.1 hypothetical protein [Hymenobacteraceae bacterium]MDX5512405.1 hypothetical protein [Hymenobacteraceae bacterium]
MAKDKEFLIDQVDDEKFKEVSTALIAYLKRAKNPIYYTPHQVLDMHTFTYGLTEPSDDFFFEVTLKGDAVKERYSGYLWFNMNGLILLDKVKKMIKKLETFGQNSEKQ